MIILSKKLEMFAEKGYKVLSYEKCIFTLACQKGHIFTKSYKSFIDSKVPCNECKKTMPKKKVNHSNVETLLNKIKNIGYIFISFNNPKIIIMCRNNHILERNIYSFAQKGFICNKCKEENNKI